MLSQEQELILSEYSGLYDIVVPQDNLLRRINTLVDYYRSCSYLRRKG